MSSTSQRTSLLVMAKVLLVHTRIWYLDWHEDISKVKVSGVNLPFTPLRYIEKCKMSRDFIWHQKSTQSQMTSSPVSHHQTRVWGFLANQNQRNVAHMMMRSNFLSCQNWKNGKNWLLSKLPLTRNMYFLASRNARCFSAFHTDVLVFVACSYFDSVRDYFL